MTPAGDTWAVLPIKETGFAKQRLARQFSQVTLDPAVAAIASRFGAKIWTDAAREGHTGAVAAAARRLAANGITRAAGASHGQEFAPELMTELILSIGRAPRQRTTLYGTPNTQRIAASFNALPLTPSIDSNVRRSRSSPLAAAQH